MPDVSVDTDTHNYIYIYHYSAVFNMAIGKPTYQSSTEKTYSSSNAVDGNRDLHAKRSSSFTRDETDPWWAVDLVDLCVVDTLEITFSMYWYCEYDIII